MFFKNLCAHVLWEKVASALEGLINPFTPEAAINASLVWRYLADKNILWKLFDGEMFAYFGKYLKEKCSAELGLQLGQIYS